MFEGVVLGSSTSFMYFVMVPGSVWFALDTGAFGQDLINSISLWRSDRKSFNFQWSRLCLTSLLLAYFLCILESVVLPWNIYFLLLICRQYNARALKDLIRWCLWVGLLNSEFWKIFIEPICSLLFPIFSSMTLLWEKNLQIFKLICCVTVAQCIIAT